MRHSDLKQLFELLESRSSVEKAIKSIDNGYVSIEELLSEDYFVHGDEYYSNDEYFILYNGDVEHRDETFYCEGLDGYFHIDDAITVYEGRRENTYSRRYVVGNCDYVYFDGDYYDYDALERNDIVYLEDTGEYTYTDNAYYCEDDGCWYSYNRE
jgi:hypothetical protein